MSGGPPLSPGCRRLRSAIRWPGRRCRSVLAGVNVFRSRQTDSITIDTSTPRWSYQNIGEATFKGIEFEGKYYFRRNLFVLGSYSYQANEDFVRGDNLAARQVWLPDWGGNTGDMIPGLRGRTVFFGIEIR